MSRALVKHEPRQLGLQLGRSLASVKPGQLIVITPDGEIYKPLPRIAHAIPAGLVLGVLGLTFGLPGLVSGAFATGMYWLLRLALPGYRRFREALVLHARFQHAEALAAVDQVNIQVIAKRWRPAVRYLRARILARLGRLSEAETALRGLVDDAFAPSAISSLRLNRWLFAIHLTEALAVQGKIEDALEQRARLEPAPDGSYFRLSRAAIDLQLVLAGADASLLDAWDLYEIAKQALSTNLYGEVCYALAFAFERAGDLEMARHMFVEAPSRTLDPSWANALPRLAAWVSEATPRLAASDDAV